MVKKISAAVVIIGCLLFAYKFWTRGKNNFVQWQTAKVERGAVRKVVMATGSINAVQTVLVGSQVSGRVMWLGADFNSIVQKGQIVAKLDPALYDADVLKAQASVQNAQAAIEAAGTEIKNAQANLAASKANQKAAKVQVKDTLALVSRYKELKNLLPGRDIEAAQAQADSAAARYDHAASQVLQAKIAIYKALFLIEKVTAADLPKYEKIFN